LQTRWCAARSLSALRVPISFVLSFTTHERDYS
jgi:hypothetical protein